MSLLFKIIGTADNFDNINTDVIYRKIKSIQHPKRYKPNKFAISSNEDTLLYYDSDILNICLSFKSDSVNLFVLYKGLNYSVSIDYFSLDHYEVKSIYNIFFFYGIINNN